MPTFLSQYPVIDLVVVGWVLINIISGFFTPLRFSISQFLVLIGFTIFARLQHETLANSLVDFIGHESTRMTATYVTIIIIGYIIASLVGSFIGSVLANSKQSFKSRFLSATIMAAASLVLLYNVIFLILFYWPQFLKNILNTGSYRFFSLVYGLFG